MARQVITDLNDPNYDPTRDPNSPYYQGGASGSVTTPPDAGGGYVIDPKDPSHGVIGGTQNLNPNFPTNQYLAAQSGFPENPTIGQAFTDPSGRSWTWGVGNVAGQLPSWNPTTPATTTQGGGGGGTGTPAGSTPTPFTFPTFTPPSFQQPSPFAAPSPYVPNTFSYGDFKAPTLEEAQNQPGYSFGLQQGEAALQNSAAARGTLRTGGTLKDLFNYANNAATQNYGNVYNQDLGTYQTNRGNAFDNFAMNEGNRAAAYGTNFNAGKDVYNINAGQNQQAYENNFQNAAATFNPQFEAAKLSFADMYDRWLASLNATTQIATAGAQ